MKGAMAVKQAAKTKGGALRELICCGVVKGQNAKQVLLETGETLSHSEGAVKFVMYSLE